MGELLPAQSVHDHLADAQAQFTLFPGCEFLRPRRPQLETITDWVKAFTIYVAVLLQRFPESTTELLAAQQYNGLQWQAYDTHFRVGAAATGNRIWSRLDMDLYTRFLTGRAKTVACCRSCDSTQHITTDCPMATGRKRDLSKPSAAQPSLSVAAAGPPMYVPCLTPVEIAASGPGASTAMSAGSAAEFTRRRCALSYQGRPRSRWAAPLSRAALHRHSRLLTSALPTSIRSYGL